MTFVQFLLDDNEIKVFPELFKEGWAVWEVQHVF